MRAKTLLTILLLLAVGLAPRLVLFDDYAFEGTGRDAAGYWNVASNLARGNGWATDSWRYLYREPASLPRPDASWSPLLPLLIAGAFRCLGESMTSAKLFPLILGAVLPIAVFGLALLLTGSRRAGLIAGILAAVHPTLVWYSMQVLTETGTALLVVLTFVALFRATRLRWLTLGLVLGLAFLMKYQSIVLLPAVLLYLLLETPGRPAIREMVLTAGVFGLVTAPWGVRNLLLFGNPFYTDLYQAALAYYSDFPTEAHCVARSAPIPFLEFCREHAAEAIGRLKWWPRYLLEDLLLRESGSRFLIPLGVMGLVSAWRERRRWASILVYACLLTAAVSITLTLTRYTSNLIAFWLVLVGAGADLLTRRPSQGWSHLSRVGLVAGMLLLSVGTADTLLETSTLDSVVRDGKGSVWTPSAGPACIHALAGRDFIQSHTKPGECVFTTETNHGAIVFQRPTINVPVEEADLISIGRRWRVRYLLIPIEDLRVRLPSWVEHPPSWAQLVRTIPPEEIPRPPRNPNYAHIQQIRIYHLDLRAGPLSIMP